MKTFPRTVYAKIESSDSDGTSWLSANADLIPLVEVGDRLRIGIYTLTEIVEAAGVVSTKRLPAKVMPKKR